MNFEWNNDKNERLKEQRGICFEDVLIAINEDGILDIIKHPNQKKYPRQKIYILKINAYIYMVPFTIQDEMIFLKTIIPSRKMKKVYTKD